MSEHDPYQKLRPSGGYRSLRSFRTTTVVYDATVSFCERFVDKRSRMVDQMVQAARSGRQNIAEGSRASATSSQTELRLVNVARASLDELLLDYEDFLRQRGKRQWLKDDAEARAVREVAKKLGGYADGADVSDAEAYAGWLNQNDPAVVANAVICLIHQANYLLDQQITGLERSFVSDGGYSETLAAARLQARKQSYPTDRSDRSDRSDKTHRTNPALPPCRLCGKPLVLRTAKQGKNAGTQFLGCSGYPECKGTCKID